VKLINELEEKPKLVLVLCAKQAAEKKRTTQVFPHVQLNETEVRTGPKGSAKIFPRLLVGE